MFGIKLAVAFALGSCAGFSTTGGGITSVDDEVAAALEVAPITAGVPALCSAVIIVRDPSIDVGGIGNWLGSGDVWKVQLAQ
jgi:hypothetical protein